MSCLFLSLIHLQKDIYFLFLVVYPYFKVLDSVSNLFYIIANQPIFYYFSVVNHSVFIVFLNARK